MSDKNKIGYTVSGLVLLCIMLVCRSSEAAPIKVMAWNVMGEITAEQFVVFDPKKTLEETSKNQPDQRKFQLN